MGSISLCLFASLSAWAQDTATIVGTVTDPTGAVVPGAKVTVSNPDKGYVRNLVSDSAGTYTAPKIPIGNYVITGEAPGFQRLVRSGITLDVGQTLRVDLMMTVGQVSQEISVTGHVAKVETETGAISDVVTGTQVAELNLNGRNFTNLAILVPGAAPGGYDPSTIGVLGGVTMSFNGVNPVFNNWEIDGANNTDEGAGGTANTSYPNIDSIAEFRISTSNYGADYGKHSGATIEVATKAGTRDFHGDLFEFVRNDHLDANDWFINQQIAPPGGNAPKRPLKRNDYGFTIGGPIYIPRHYNTGKSKTFFFWTEDWRKNREGTVIRNWTPTMRMRQGDFSECDPTPGNPNYNPTVASSCVLPSGPGVTGDIVPIDPNAAALLNGLVPLPNSGPDTYVAAHSLPTNWRQDQIRVDQNIGNKTSLFVRYTQEAYDQDFVPTLWNNSSFDTVKTKWSAPVKTAVLHFTHTFKPNLMNEFVMGFSADVNLIQNVTGPSSPAKSVYKPSVWNVSNLFAANAKETLLPSIGVNGGLPGGFGESTGYAYFYWGPITTGKDNLVWSVGRHTLKLGFFLQYAALNQTENAGNSTQGFMNFSNSASNTTGNALADMYLGRIQQYTEVGTFYNGTPVGGYPLGHWRQWDFEPYVQDDWKVTPKLTLNLGVRYYLLQPFHDILAPNLDTLFQPNLYNPAHEAQLDASGNLIPGTGHTFLTYGNGLLNCGTGGVPAGCYNPSRGTVAPRFGFAYDPTSSGKTAVRGGFGVFYEMGNGNQGAAGFFGNPPTEASSSAFNVTGFQRIVPGPTGPSGVTTLAPNQKWASVYQFSLGIQHEFPGNNLLTTSYVGTLGRHLGRSRNINQVRINPGITNAPALANANPYCDASGNCDVQQVLINNLAPTIYFAPYRGYTTLDVRDYTSVSSYNSLQVNFRHTTGHGLTLQTAYTWAHAIDDGNTSGPGNSLGVNDYDLSRWRATSSLNQTHVLAINFVYDLPFFKSSSNAVVKVALGGWRVSGISSFATGQPINFGCGISGLSSGVGGGVRCNSLGPVKIHKSVYNDPVFGPVQMWFDPSTIGQVTVDQLRADGQPGMFGYMGRNPLTGPGRNNWDLALLKEFSAPWFRSEHSTLQFRWETFNTFNHPQWNGVNAGCGGSTPPGTPCSGVANNYGNGEVNSAWPARIMQFGLKFIF
jgi:hypothetical protein